MEEINLKKAQEIQLDILKYVHKFCKENKLRYFLCYGTLIGAARHKGFIPWDDDIDIQMPREDYEKLISLFNKKRENENYVLMSPYDENPKYTFTKICDIRTAKIEEGMRYENEDYFGVDIDVFPIDGQADTKEGFDKEFKKKRFWYLVFNSKVSTSIGTGLKPMIINFCAKFYSKKKIVEKTEKLNKRNDYKTSKKVGVTACLFTYKEDYFDKEVYSDVVKLQFEDAEFDAPIGYDTVLRGIYSDYMTPPPKEKRVTHHKNKMYFKNS